MKKLFTLLCLICISVSSFSQNTYNIVPVPEKLVPQTGAFKLTKDTKVVFKADDSETQRIARLFVDQINTASGLKVLVKPGSTGSSNVIELKSDAALTEEAYKLDVTPKKITITAKGNKGYFYAFQSLMQLLPADVFSSVKVSDIKWEVPACKIEDAPRYAYRGLMLDVGRHFFPVSFIKKFIDILALHKLNNFHWHLTEDQGWRIEIKKYPLLTQVGSKRKETLVGHFGTNKYDGKEYGGFYTQEEVKEVVAYATSKYVNVIPEIELPGHATAALAAYPKLGCNPDKIYQVVTTWGVHDDVFCPREETFTFLEDVLTEVIALFPSQYIHIGGDECPKKQWKESRFCQDLMKREGLKDEHELQSYFIRRIDKFITSKGRKMIGWDEILEGGLSPNATVMSWRGVDGGIAAAKENHDAIMTPTGYFYLDYYQADPKTEPLAIGGYLPLEKTYSYEPMPKELTAEQQKHIIGVQANIWTEYMGTPEYVEYMAYPRASALSEIAWSPKELKNYQDFEKRMKVHVKRLENLKVNFCNAFITGKK